MDPFARKEQWLEASVRKLTADGFTLLPSPFKAAARRSRFELSKFGNAETFFTFAEFDSLDMNWVRRFSTDAFTFAMQSKTSSLPCGLFESVWSFAVAIAHHVDDITAQRVRVENPPAHWSAGEMRAIYDTRRHQIYYYEQTPLWAGAYYNGLRQQIQRYLF